jgi:hypothetical protein
MATTHQNKKGQRIFLGSGKLKLVILDEKRNDD